MIGTYILRRPRRQLCDAAIRSEIPTRCWARLREDQGRELYSNSLFGCGLQVSPCARGPDEFIDGLISFVLERRCWGQLALMCCLITRSALALGELESPGGKLASELCDLDEGCPQDRSMLVASWRLPPSRGRRRSREESSGPRLSTWRSTIWAPSAGCARHETRRVPPRSFRCLTRACCCCRC